MGIGITDGAYKLARNGLWVQVVSSLLQWHLQQQQQQNFSSLWSPLSPEMQWHLRGAVTKLVACHPAITWLHFCIYSEPKLQQKPNNLAQVTAGSRRPYKLSQDNDEEEEEQEEEEVDAGSFQGNAKL
ncbi:hypothetical protein ACLKA7_002043 [Drosophila subpalustris]